MIRGFPKYLDTGLGPLYWLRDSVNEMTSNSIALINDFISYNYLGIDVYAAENRKRRQRLNYIPGSWGEFPDYAYSLALKGRWNKLLLPFNNRFLICVHVWGLCCCSVNLVNYVIIITMQNGQLICSISFSDLEITSSEIASQQSPVLLPHRPQTMDASALLGWIGWQPRKKKT